MLDLVLEAFLVLIVSLFYINLKIFFKLIKNLNLLMTEPFLGPFSLGLVTTVTILLLASLLLFVVLLLGHFLLARVLLHDAILV